MGKNKQWFDDLKNLAQSIADDSSKHSVDVESKDIADLINEIQVYQVELEIQNEELRGAQISLESSRDRLSKLFHMAPVGYVLLNKSGMIIDVNQTFLNMIKKERDTLLRRPFSENITADDHRKFFSSFNAFYKNPAGKVIDIRLNRADGSMFYSRLEGRFIDFGIHSADQGNTHLCLAVSDISQIKKAQTALKRSEAEYRNLVGAINDAIVSADLNGNIVVFNQSAQILFGVSEKEALGLNISRFCPDEFKEKQRDMMHRVLESGFVLPYETERIGMDNRRFPVEISLSVRTNDKGENIGFNAVMRDITVRKQQEDKLIKSEEKLKFILDSLPDMIVEVDADMTIKWANKTALELNPDARGKPCYEAFPGKDDICDDCYCAKAFLSKKTESGIMHQPASTTSGDSYWENIGIPLNTSEGGQVTVLEVSRDVTERVKIEKEKEKLILELQKALKEIKTLSGLLPICSHCKKIRDDKGYWNQIEHYIHEHSDATFSHGICQDCLKIHYPDYDIHKE